MIFFIYFLRLIHLTTQRTRSSSETFRSFQKAIEFFSGQGFCNTYKLFGCDRGSEFRGNFLRRIKSEYNISTYHTHIGPHSKIAIVERAVRSAKEVFFRYLQSMRLTHA